MKFPVVVFAVLLIPVAAARAQQPSDPRPIQDNSFLVEEAYNQEAGVVQHIFTFARSIGDPGWTFSFTQEWPVGSQKHQLSCTIPALSVDTDSGFDAGLGDVAINYRYQLVGNGDAAVAFAPRFSLIFPTGSARLGVETGTWDCRETSRSASSTPAISSHIGTPASPTFTTRSCRAASGRRREP